MKNNIDYNQFKVCFSENMFESSSMIEVIIESAEDRYDVAPG